MDELNRWSMEGGSFVLRINNEFGPHYVVFEGTEVTGSGTNDVNIHYNDPNPQYTPDRHHRMMSWDEFSRRWTGDTIWVQR